MIVTARAMNRQAQEGGDGVGYHVVAVEHAGLLFINGALAQLDVADKVPRTGGNEPRGDDSFGIIGEEHVAGNLLLDEALIGLVRIERADDVVAIRPGVIPAFVLVVAVCVAVVHDIQPVAAPAFAITRRSQQPVNEPLVGAGATIVDEIIHLFGCRRQAMQIESHAPNERAPVGRGRRLEALGFKGGEDKGIDGGPRPGVVYRCRNGRPSQRS